MDDAPVRVVQHVSALVENGQDDLERAVDAIVAEADHQRSVVEAALALTRRDHPRRDTPERARVIELLQTALRTGVFE